MNNRVFSLAGDSAGWCPRAIVVAYRPANAAKTGNAVEKIRHDAWITISETWTGFSQVAIAKEIAQNLEIMVRQRLLPKRR